MESGEIRASGTRWRFGTYRIHLPSAVFVCFIAIAQLANAEAISVREEFKSNDFDREKWKVDKVEAKNGQVELNDESLHFSLPAGPIRPKFGVHGKFGVDGDFEISMDFKIEEFPTPEAEFVNTEIVLYSKDGIAYFSRVNHKGAGQGYIVYFAPSKESGQKSLWKHEPGTDLKGTLRIKRIGDQVSFLYQPDGESIANKIASVSFGTGRIDKVSYSVNVAGAIDRAMDVRLDNLDVRSIETQVAQNSPSGQPQRSLFGPASWIGLVVVVVIAGIVAVIVLKMKS